MPDFPNFFIVGAPKAGTSSLYEYLKQHPDIYMSAVKEPHYFCSHQFPAQFAGPGDDEFSRSVFREAAPYQQLFADRGERRIAGEASVFYLHYPDTAEKIRQWNPQAKVIAILRNPIDRAYSAYMHLVRDNRENLTFEQALRMEDQRIRNDWRPLWWYRELGRYSPQISRYQAQFDPDHFKVFLYEDLQDTPSMMRHVLEFLGVDPHAPIDTSIRHNISGVPTSRKMYEFFANPHPVKEWAKSFLPNDMLRKLGHYGKRMALRREDMHPRTRRRLIDAYRDDIEHVQAQIGRDLSHWLEIRSD